MSEQEHEQQFEQKARVKVSRNAKGEAQWEISVPEGTNESVLDEARKIAVRQYDALEEELGTSAS